MNKETLAENVYRPWLVTAMAVPLAEAAGQCSWITAGIVGGVVLVFCYWLKPVKRKWLSFLQWAGISVLLTEFMYWTHSCWPGEGMKYIIPITLIFLAAASADKGTEKAARSGSVLRYGIYFVLAAVLISGAVEIKIKNLDAEWRMQSASLVTVLLLPLIGGYPTKKKNMKVFLYLYETAAAVIISGVLAGKGGLYELSRSIRLLGAAERMESITAGAMTLGYFVLFGFLLSKAGTMWRNWSGGEEKNGVRLSALISALWYITQWRIPGQGIALMTITLWGFIPLITVLIINIKKDEKGVDK